MHRLLYTATAVLVLVAAVSVITHSANDVIGTTTTAPARHYYLTKGTFHGNQALTACSTGYHFASFAELDNPSFLAYNKTLGRNAADSGSGPPTYLLGIGWIRTGYSSNANANGDSFAATNCNLWTSGNSTDFGEVMFFALDSNSGTGSPSIPTFINSLKCDTSNGGAVGVWCVQN